jgi:transposase
MIMAPLPGSPSARLVAKTQSDEFHNMKTVVDKVGCGKQRTVNKRFLAMVSHYLFEAEFCNPSAGWEKGQVGKNVRDARRYDRLRGNKP